MLVVKGVLANPFGNPIAEAVIRFTAIVAEGSVLKGVDAECVTTKEGEYEFNLQYGRYRLEVLHEDEFHESGLILVDENLPSPITLTSLVLYARPYEPPLLNPDKPVWDELYKDVLGSDEWERQAEEQVRDGDVLVNEDKSIHKNGDAYLAKETHTTGIESTIQSTQTLTYKDEYAQEASVSTSKNSTRNSSTVESLGSYTYSDGSTEAEKRVELIGSIGSTTQVMTEDKDTLDKVKGIQSTHVEESAGSTTATYKHGENQVSTTTAVKYMDADKFVQALIEQNVKLTYSNNGFPVEAFNRLLVNPAGSVNTLQVDKHIIQAVDGFPIATFDTANREIVFDSKLTFKNTDDFIGEEGWSYDYEFTYSFDQDVWFDVYQQGAIWRKERKFRFKAERPEDTKQYIGEAIITQLNAVDGQHGDQYYLEYEYTTAESYPVGWRSNYLSGDDWRRWRSVRVTPTGTELSAWQDEPIKGEDGVEGWIPEWEMYYGPDATKVFDKEDPTNTLSDWHSNFGNSDLYKYERLVWWFNSKDYIDARNSGGAIDWTKAPVPAQKGAWNGPVKVKPEKGVDYFDGTHGAGSYVIVGYTKAEAQSFTNAERDAHLSGASGSEPTKGDILTYTDTGKTYSLSFLRDETKWTGFSFTFDGSVIVNGTLAAEALKAETTITDKLYISSTKSKTEMTLSGAGDYRMWSGNADPVLANFSIDRWGNLKANNAKLTNADVSGKVTASSGSFTGTVNANAGTFNNVTIAENCNVLGTIYANRIVGDVTKVLHHKGGFTVEPYERSRSLFLCRGYIAFSKSDFPDSGAISLTVRMRMNGNVVASATDYSNQPTPGYSRSLGVFMYPSIIIPANTRAVITYTFESSGGGAGPTINETKDDVAWLLSLSS